MTKADILNYVRYDEQTGYFYDAQASTRVDQINSNGYAYVRVDKTWFAAHRLAWFLLTNNFPSSEIDHINRCRSDNRACNLREATKSQNQVNGNCGKGYSRNGSKWKAAIKVKGRQIHLGTFATREEAQNAYLQARQKYFAEFAN